MTNQAKTLQDAVDDALIRGVRSMVKCPAHDDSTPSLSVSPGGNPGPGQEPQPVVFKCHASCTPEAIIEAGGLDWAQVMAPPDPVKSLHERAMWTPAGVASHVYPYHDARGQLLFEVLRIPQPGGGKTIRQRRPDASSTHGYAWNLDGVERVLYRLPDVLRAVQQGMTVHVAEGEKCADALQQVIPHGEVATTNPGGADRWLPQYGEQLSGATVVVYADSDEIGRVHARKVRDSVMEHGGVASIKEAPPGTMRSGKAINDVADHLEAGLPLSALLETTPEQEVERARTGIDILDLIRRPRGTIEWVVPRTLAKGERLILIGFEGSGKSTWCRQFGVMVAAGLHPWTQEEIEPKRVLIIDAENHPYQVEDDWLDLVDLAVAHNKPIERGRLVIMEEHESEIGLDTLEGSVWLEERVYAYRPDLVVMGPLTNLASKDLRDDEPVRRMRNAVNKARMICNSAFLMEHHAPHKSPGDKERQVRPYGSSLFLKWPDYGFGMKPTETRGVYEWIRNRGPRVRSRRWPDWIREGRENSESLEWKWMECEYDPKTGVVTG